MLFSARLSAAFSLAILSLLVVLLVSVPQEADAKKKTCRNFFGCIGGLFSIPFSQIANASFYYTTNMLRLSGISDEDFDAQTSLLNRLCQTWANFDTCMDADWIDCMDWDQLVTLTNLVGGEGDRQTQTDSRQGQAARNELLNSTYNSLENIGWSKEKSKKVAKVATYMCKNMPVIIPSMKCFRNVILMNETIINITTWYGALIDAECNGGLRTATCHKTEVLTKLLGHWLYHGCQEGIERMTDVVRVIFESMMFTSEEKCVDIFTNKTAKDIFEPRYPPQWAISFGEPDDEYNACNKTLVRKFYDAYYQNNIWSYIHERNFTDTCDLFSYNYCRYNATKCKAQPLACMVKKMQSTRAPATTTAMITTTEETEPPSTKGRVVTNKNGQIVRLRTTSLARTVKGLMASQRTSSTTTTTSNIKAAVTQRLVRKRTTRSWFDEDNNAAGDTVGSRSLPLLVGVVLFSFTIHL